jgi:hypothetical protein
MLTTFMEQHKLAALILIVVLGLSLRLHGLGSVGFNEDEVQKVVAARSYLHGKFSVNLEHPMLMKSLIAISLAATDVWNGRPGQPHPVPEELAVRLPNVLFGALTAVVIFLLGQELFGFGTGLLSALLWSIGTIAIMVNRVAKEDTLLVLFTWLAYYLYLRAKTLSTTREGRARHFYAASGAGFGLMLASKYFPHYLGLNALYYYLCERHNPGQRWGKRIWLLFLGTLALVFVLLDPIVLVPGTLKYMLHYVSGSSITHHGYLVMGRLCRDDVVGLSGGMPAYFYVLLLAIKTPLPVLAALLVGLVEIWRRRRERGSSFLLFVFLLWIVPFSLVGSKWLRYMLAWMPAVYIVAAVGLARMCSWLSAMASRRMSGRWAQALVAAFAVVFVANPVWAVVKSAPYYSLYLNAFGLGRTAYYFPHDEMNDMGLRAAIERISEVAPQGASVGGEAEPVFKYYFHKFGRDDLQYFDLSDAAKRLNAPYSAYLVVQDGREYFENASFVQSIESRQLPIETVRIGGGDAARVYHGEEFAELRTGR